MRCSLLLWTCAALDALLFKGLYNTNTLHDTFKSGYFNVMYNRWSLCSLSNGSVTTLFKRSCCDFSVFKAGEATDFRGIGLNVSIKQLVTS